MKILTFLAVVVLTYYAMAIVQTLLHRAFGHRNRIRRIFVNHAIGHHAKYRRDALTSDVYIDSETYVMFYYAIPVALLGIAVYLLAGALILVAFVGGVALAFWLHLYLHEQYHLAGSTLARFRWFRRKRELHFVHHRHVRKNYAIVEFWIDRVIGTLQDPSANREDREVFRTAINEIGTICLANPAEQTVQRGAQYDFKKAGDRGCPAGHCVCMPEGRYSCGRRPGVEERLRLYG